MAQKDRGKLLCLELGILRGHICMLMTMEHGLDEKAVSSTTVHGFETSWRVTKEEKDGPIYFMD